MGTGGDFVLGHLLFALIISLVFASILSGLAGRRTGGPPFLWLFLGLVLTVWAGGVWLVPFGPAILGLYPFPFIVTGLALALFIAALASSRPPRASTVQGSPGYRGNEELGPMVMIFWLLLSLMALAVVTFYLKI